MENGSLEMRLEAGDSGDGREVVVTIANTDDMNGILLLHCVSYTNGRMPPLVKLRAVAYPAAPDSKPLRAGFAGSGSCCYFFFDFRWCKSSKSGA